jgi:hypothetical protein
VEGLLLEDGAVGNQGHGILDGFAPRFFLDPSGWAGIVEEGGIHAPIVLSHLISGPAIQTALIYVKTREFGAKPNPPANEANDC